MHRLLVALLLLAGLAVACAPPTPTPNIQATVNAAVQEALAVMGGLEPTPVYAEALYAQFEADPAGARTRYAQQTLTVTGVVESVGYEAGHPLLTLATAGKWGVQCFPSHDSEARPSQRLVGTEATIQGSGVHWVWHVVVQDCRVTETDLAGVERPTLTPQSAQAAPRTSPTATPFRIFELSPTLTPMPLFSPSCCKYCSKGKACGNTCISRSFTCHVGVGCACNR